MFVNVKVKESWEIEGPVGLAPAERGPTELRECECEIFICHENVA